MKKRVLSIFLVMTLVLTMLTGCGGGENASSDEAANPNKLTVWAWDKQFNIYAMEEAVKIYQADHPEFEVEISEVSWNDVQTKLGTIVGSGNYDQLPDILLMQDFAYQKYVVEIRAMLWYTLCNCAKENQHELRNHQKL